MPGTIKMTGLKKIDEKELQYGFSKKQIEQFLHNRVLIDYVVEGLRHSTYRGITNGFIRWCNENCEGFFMVAREYHESEYPCFFFQLESDAAHFKLVHNATDF